MEAFNFMGLDDYERRCIMLRMPVPDLLRLSATSRGQRSDLFRLMHGDLDVQLTISLPRGEGRVVTVEEERGLENEASFRAFMAAGGAALVKSLKMKFITDRQPDASPLVWPPLPELESLSVTCNVYFHEIDGVDFVLRLIACPIIGTSSELRAVHFSFLHKTFKVNDVLKRISGAVGSVASRLTDVSLHVSLSHFPLAVLDVLEL